MPHDNVCARNESHELCSKLMISAEQWRFIEILIVCVRTSIHGVFAIVIRYSFADSHVCMFSSFELNRNNNLLNRSGHVLHVVYCSRGMYYMLSIVLGACTTCCLLFSNMTSKTINKILLPRFSAKFTMFPADNF